VTGTPKRPLESKEKGSAASAPRCEGWHAVAGENRAPRAKTSAAAIEACRRDPRRCRQGARAQAKARRWEKRGREEGLGLYRGSIDVPRRKSREILMAASS